MVFVTYLLTQAEKPVPFHAQCCQPRRNDQVNVGAPYSNTWDKLTQCCVLLTQPKNFQLVLFCFLSAIWTNIESSVDIAVRWKWTKVQQLQQQMVAILCLLFMAIAMVAFKTCILNTHWRRLTTIILMLFTFLKLCIELSACSIKSTDQYVYLITDLLEVIPQGLLMLFVSLCAAAISPPKHEATIYNILVTLQFIPIPLSRIAINVFTDYLPVFVSTNSDNYQSLAKYENYDTPVTTNFRLKVMFAFMSVAFIKVLLMPMVYLLPESYRVAQLQSTIAQFSTKKIVCKLLFIVICVSASISLPIVHAYVS